MAQRAPFLYFIAIKMLGVKKRISVSPTTVALGKNTWFDEWQPKMVEVTRFEEILHTPTNRFWQSD